LRRIVKIGNSLLVFLLVLVASCSSCAKKDKVRLDEDWKHEKDLEKIVDFSAYDQDAIDEYEYDRYWYSGH
jgi:hypothetical protein